MSEIISCGHVRSDSDREREPDERKLLQTNLLRLLASTVKILQEPKVYFCAPACCWCSWLYVGGDG